MMIRPMHKTPRKAFLDFILLPVGYAYNADIASAKQGDTMRMLDGDDVTIDSVLRLSIKMPITDVLCRMRYGISIKRALLIWRNNAIASGFGANALDNLECLAVFYDKENR